MNTTRYPKSYLVKAIKISDLCNEENIQLEAISSGNFTHRCKCPFSGHKSGKERTQSLYIDSINNNFYCFGCGASNNSIDFFMNLKSITFSDAIKELSLRIDPNDINISIEKEDIIVKRSILPVLLEISSLFREVYKRTDLRDLKTLDELSRKTDIKIEDLDIYDIAGATKLLNKVKKYIEKLENK